MCIYIMCAFVYLLIYIYIYVYIYKCTYIYKCVYNISYYIIYIYIYIIHIFVESILEKNYFWSAPRFPRPGGQTLHAGAGHIEPIGPGRGEIVPPKKNGEESNCVAEIMGYLWDIMGDYGILMGYLWDIYGISWEIVDYYWLFLGN